MPFYSAREDYFLFKEKKPCSYYELLMSKMKKSPVHGKSGAYSPLLILWQLY